MGITFSGILLSMGLEGFTFEQPDGQDDSKDIEQIPETPEQLEEIDEKEIAFRGALFEGLRDYPDEERERIPEQMDLLFTKKQQERVPVAELQSFFEQNKGDIESGKKDAGELLNEFSNAYFPEDE